MKKFLITAFLGFMVSVGMISIVPIREVSALESSDIFINNGSKSGFFGEAVYDFVPDNTSKLQTGDIKVRKLVEVIRKYVYRILIPLAVVFSVYAGIQLILARGKEDTFKEKKQQILAYFYGFVIMLLSIVAVDGIFFGKDGSLLMETGSPSKDLKRISQFAERGFVEFEGLFNYLITFAAVVAVAFVIYSAIRLMSATDSDAEQKKFRKNMMYIVMGMAIMVSAKKVVDLLTGTKSELAARIVGPDHALKVPQVSGTIAFVIDWVNFILGLTGVISVIALIYGGVILITNMGTSGDAKDKAMKILKGAITGLILTFSAWTIMYFFFFPENLNA